VVPVAEAMAALVIYDAWLTQQDLVEGSVPEAPEWDWDAVDRLLGPA